MCPSSKGSGEAAGTYTSPEPWLLADVISKEISCAGSYIYSLLQVPKGYLAHEDTKFHII